MSVCFASRFVGKNRFLVWDFNGDVTSAATGDTCAVPVGTRGESPNGNRSSVCYLVGMNLLVILLVLLLLFGGGGFYLGGPVIGGSGIGLVLVICLIVYFMGGFRTRS